MTERRAYTPRTLAERWECSERHIYNLVREGKLRSFRAGTLIRFNPDDVLEYERGRDRPVSSYELWKLNRESKARRSA